MRIGKLEHIDSYEKRKDRERNSPTLRDQFAMSAVPALLADRDSPAVYLADVAKAAYDLADDLLAAREAK